MIVVHCSDSPDDNYKVDVNTIRGWHMNERGFKDVGYHFVITRDGTIQVGRKENGDLVLAGDEIGAHTVGYNSKSIGICWVGRDRIAPEQYRSLVYWLAVQVKHYGLTIGKIYGHGELNHDKTCPRLKMGEVRADVEKFIQKGGVIDGY